MPLALLLPDSPLTWKDKLYLPLELLFQDGRRGQDETGKLDQVSRRLSLGMTEISHVPLCDKNRFSIHSSKDRARQ